MFTLAVNKLILLILLTGAITKKCGSQPHAALKKGSEMLPPAALDSQSLP